MAVVDGLRAHQGPAHFGHHEVAAVLHAGVALEVEVVGEDLPAPPLPLLVVDAEEVAGPELPDLVDVAQALDLGAQLVE